MRGTPHVVACEPSRRRFIPAHAGNSALPVCLLAWVAVHPRACGELQYPSVGSTCGNGSSPRMRGTLTHAFGIQPINRFIPAHAGNSRDHIARSGTSAVHPRACGELERGHGEHVQPVGSSPRMRGTRRMGRFDSRPRRFIPAHAGNSVFGAVGWVGLTVHPRACGELKRAVVATLEVDGSSPRMRGTFERLP